MRVALEAGVGFGAHFGRMPSLSHLPSVLWQDERGNYFTLDVGALLAFFIAFAALVGLLVSAYTSFVPQAPSAEGGQDDATPLRDAAQV